MKQSRELAEHSQLKSKCTKVKTSRPTSGDAGDEYRICEYLDTVSHYLQFSQSDTPQLSMNIQIYGNAQLTKTDGHSPPSLNQNTVDPLSLTPFQPEQQLLGLKREIRSAWNSSNSHRREREISFSRFKQVISEFYKSFPIMTYLGVLLHRPRNYLQ